MLYQPFHQHKELLGTWQPHCCISSFPPVRQLSTTLSDDIASLEVMETENRDNNNVEVSYLIITTVIITNQSIFLFYIRMGIKSRVIVIYQQQCRIECSYTSTELNFQTLSLLTRMLTSRYLWLRKTKSTIRWLEASNETDTCWSRRCHLYPSAQASLSRWIEAQGTVKTG